MATGDEKAALILGRMPTELAEVVLTQLGPDRALRLRSRMEEVRKSPSLQAAADQALADFRDLLRGARMSLTMQTAAASPRAAGSTESQLPAGAQPFVPSKALAANSEQAQANIRGYYTASGQEQPGEHTAPSGQDTHEESAPTEIVDPIGDLKNMEAATLAAVLRVEHVPVIVMTLDCLSPEKAGEVLKLLDPALRRPAAMRLGQTSAPKPELMNEIARAVVIRSRALAEDPAEADPDMGVKKMAVVLRNLEREDRKEILTTLEAQDPLIAERIKKLLYVFEDILRVENRSLQDLLGQVDMRTLAVALRGAEADIKTKILENLSARAGDTLREELELLTTVAPAAVRTAQSTLVAVLQRMDQDGKLVMVE